MTGKFNIAQNAFQFQMVRLKFEYGPSHGKYLDVSIPNGSIKIYERYFLKVCCVVSIPNGSIKITCLA